MGCERESALDGLSDHLLALRAVLEGHGPVGASLPMRAAALIADDSLDRIEARERVEDALELERALMNGRSLERSDRARRLGRGGRAPAAAAGRPRRARQRPQRHRRRDPDRDRPRSRRRRDRGLTGPDRRRPRRHGSRADRRAGTRPESRRRARFASNTCRPPNPSSQPRRSTWSRKPASWSRSRPRTRSRSRPRPWLDEVSEERRGDSLEWPAAEERDIQHRERIDTPRVRHLFPVPEDADWEVSHLEFELRSAPRPRTASGRPSGRGPAGHRTRSSPVANR